MNSLLSCAFFEQRCNACGGSFRVSLQQVLMEHRVNHEWQSPHPCSVCSIENRQAMWAIPVTVIEELERAWERVASAAERAGIPLVVGA